MDKNKLIKLYEELLDSLGIEIMNPKFRFTNIPGSDLYFNYEEISILEQIRGIYMYEGE